MDFAAHFRGCSNIAARTQISRQTAPASAHAAYAFVAHFPQPVRAYPCALEDRFTSFKFINSNVYPEKPYEIGVFEILGAYHRILFHAAIAFSNRLMESDSGAVEWRVESKYPGGLRRVAPTGDVITEYDRAHFQDYIRLLDAHSAGMNSDEMCRSILDIDPAEDLDGAQKVLNSHLERAFWMSNIGFRQI